MILKKPFSESWLRMVTHLPREKAVAELIVGLDRAVTLDASGRYIWQIPHDTRIGFLAALALAQATIGVPESDSEERVAALADAREAYELLTSTLESLRGMAVKATAQRDASAVEELLNSLRATDESQDVSRADMQQAVNDLRDAVRECSGITDSHRERIIAKLEELQREVSTPGEDFADRMTSLALMVLTTVKDDSLVKAVAGGALLLGLNYLFLSNGLPVLELSKGPVKVTLDPNKE